MITTVKAALVSFAMLNVANAGTIPMPDGIIYGKLSIDGQVVSPDNGMAVLARVGGLDEPVAVYHMGDLPAAGSAYVLHIPKRLEADGITPTADTAPTAAPASIYLVEEGGSEVLAGRAPVPAMGKAVLLDIDISDSELAAGRAVTASTRGGLCGAMGMVSLGWMGIGLMTLRRMSTASRRRM